MQDVTLPIYNVLHLHINSYCQAHLSFISTSFLIGKKASVISHVFNYATRTVRNNISFLKQLQMKCSHFYNFSLKLCLFVSTNLGRIVRCFSYQVGTIYNKFLSQKGCPENSQYNQKTKIDCHFITATQTSIWEPQHYKTDFQCGIPYRFF